MKRILITPLLILISLLNMGFWGKPKLEALICTDEEYLKELTFEEKWEDNYPWIYDSKTGKLYDYDPFLNEINVLETWRYENDVFTYKSKLEKNTLKIIETEINNKYADNRYLIDIKANTSVSYNLENPENKFRTICESLDFPNGVKINY